ncbi:MAG: chemotaxis protein CheC [Candidatus Omnitrophota bacterium]
MQDEFDILREVGSVAAGHGSNALSEILGKKISLKFPTVNIITSLEAPSHLKLEKLVIATLSKLLTGIEGEVVLLFDGENASKLINLSYRMDKDIDTKPGIITEMSLSLIKETGNVIVASYANALSIMLGKMIIPTIPILISGGLADILRIILAAHEKLDYCFLIESIFEEQKSGLKGGFFMVLTPYAARDIKAICNRFINKQT